MEHAHAIDKIQKLAEKRKSDKIIKYLDSADAEVVVAALKALSDIKDEDSVNSIAGMIDNENDEIRKEVACALGEIGSEYAKTYLQHRMTTEKNEEVKTAIMDALHAIAAKKNA